MKITLLPVGNSPTPFVFADDTVGEISTGYPWTNGVGGICKEGFLPGQRRAVQGVEYFRGLFKGNIPRGQLENSLKFTVQRTFNTLDNALAFLASHADNVPESGLLIMTLTGIGTRYLQNAVVQDIQTTLHKGVSCDTTYSIVGSYDPVLQTGGAWQLTPTK